jgi:hypothetical protein
MVSTASCHLCVWGRNRPGRFRSGKDTNLASKYHRAVTEELAENLCVLGRVSMKSPAFIYEFATKFAAYFTVFAFLVGVGLALVYPEATTAIRIAEKAMMTSLIALLGLLGGKALKK